jgi:hypothetical protein
MPSLPACRRRAPTVRFIAREITETRVLAFECLLSSRWSPFDHGRIFPLRRPFAFLADFLILAIVTSKQRVVVIMETTHSRHNMIASAETGSPGQEWLPLGPAPAAPLTSDNFISLLEGAFSFAIFTLLLLLSDVLSHGILQSRSLECTGKASCSNQPQDLTPFNFFRKSDA